jgi:hypothetical protein
MESLKLAEGRYWISDKNWFEVKRSLCKLSEPFSGKQPNKSSMNSFSEMPRRLSPDFAQISVSYPRRSQVGCQVVPSQALWYTALSVPTPKQSSLLGAQDTTVGAVVKIPPNESQFACHTPEEYALWYIAPSVPIPKTSRPPERHETADGTLVKMPPRLCHPVQVEPSQ